MPASTCAARSRRLSPRMRDLYLRGGKRAGDVVLGSLALVLLSPVMLLVAAIVYIAFGRPILFKQVRVGLRSRTFTLIKFRTMSDARNEEGALLPDARRLTPMGDALRRYSL